MRYFESHGCIIDQNIHAIVRSLHVLGKATDALDVGNIELMEANALVCMVLRGLQFFHGLQAELFVAC